MSRQDISCIPAVKHQASSLQPARMTSKGRGETPSGSRRSKAHTRSAGPVFAIDLAFPQLQIYSPVTKLPSLASVVGMLRYYTDPTKLGRGRTKEAGVAEVAKQVYAKWYHDSVTCITMKGLKKKLDNLLNQVKEGHKRYQQEGKESQKRKALVDYKEMVYKKDQLFDIFPRKANGEKDIARQKAVEKEWGVQMGNMEEIYYEDQRTERKMECGREVDVVWYQAMMKKQRAKEKLETYRKQMNSQFLYKTLQEIEETLLEDGSLSNSSDESSTKEIPAKKARIDFDEEEALQLHADAVPTLEEADADAETEADEDAEKEADADADTEAEAEAGDHNVEKKKENKKFAKKEEDRSDSMPEKFRHIRKSERKVKDEVLIAIGNMTGEGLSLQESALAVVEVGNVIFERKWKMPEDEEDTFDVDTLPDKKNIREALKQQEAQDLDLMVDELEKGKGEQRPLTHFTDSTTKRGVGQFAAQGIHIGRDNPYPLPILSIDGEKTEDVAMQVDMALSLVAVVRGVTTADLYKMIDTHMTDSVEHNKGLAGVIIIILFYFI